MNTLRKKIAWIIFSLILPISMQAKEKKESAVIKPLIVPQVFNEAKKNTNWKLAFATGKQEQIVFMNVSLQTNPDNEIGNEKHPFDQVILIVEGEGKVTLNEMTGIVKEGDMIFIPQGTPHNVINLGKEKPLKLISFYSQTDIPKGATYKRKADQAPGS